MRGITFAATFAGMFYGMIAAGATSAEAARNCGPGKVWRPSIKTCQPYRTAVASGARIYSRYAKASIKHRYKRPPVKRAAVETPEPPARQFPQPTPPWIERTPVVEGFEADVIAPSPFGRLLPMPETVTAWAIRNGVEQ